MLLTPGGDAAGPARTTPLPRLTTRSPTQVATRRIELGRTALAGASLHNIEVSVSWQDGGRRPEVVLNSVVEGAAP